MIYNTHVHLNSPSIQDEIPVLIDRAIEKNVTKMIVVGFDLESSKEALRLAKSYPFINAAVGIHPCDLAKMKESDFQEIAVLAKNKEVVAIGEVGLDYYWDGDKKELQKNYFEKFIQLAFHLQKPLIIHMRDASEDTLLLLKKNQAYLKYGGVMHCYSGSYEMSLEFIKLGFYISLAGPVTFKNALTPKKVAMEIPASMLLVETDCPYLAPHPLRGKVNEPSNVHYIVKEIASLRSSTYETIAQVTYDNAIRLFGK